MPDPLLPDPKDVKALMTVMSARLAVIVDELSALAAAYGIHGELMRVGGVCFQVTRYHEAWSVFMWPWPSAPNNDSVLHNILGVRMDQKILFLDNADDFTEAYKDRIISVHEALRRVTNKK